jgi:hypothetical protein
MTTYTLEHIASAIGVSKDAAKKRAARESWPYTEEPCRGGYRRRYALEDLPQDVREALQRYEAVRSAQRLGISTGHLGDRQHPECLPAPDGLAAGDGLVSGALAGGASEYPAISSSLPGIGPGLPSPQASPAAEGVFSEAMLARMADDLASRPARVREEALRRARACLTLKSLLDAGIGARLALTQAASEHGVPAGTLARWWYGHGAFPGVAGVARVDAWPALLAPRWGQAVHEAPMSGAAWDQLLKAYLRPEKPSLKRCYRDVAAAAKRHGWQVPSYASVARRVEKLDPRLVVLARDGREAFERMYPPIKRSVAHLSALEWVNADGHKLDLFVNLPERFGGGVGRAHLVSWQDIYSRKILAWRLTPTLNAFSVILSFADLVTQYGIPDHALMDNGREFGAKAVSGGAPWRFRFKTQPEEMLGVLPLLGVTVHWATPFHGQSKPIERAFRDLAEGIAKDPRLAGAWTGNRPEAKPDNYGSKAADWDLVAQVCAEAIAEHNARVGRRTETAKGRSFDAVFAESYARRVVKRLAPSQRALLLLASEPVKVRVDNSFEVAGNTYGVDPALGLGGQRVVARFDPDDLRQPVLVFDLEGRMLGEARPTAARFDDGAAAQAAKRAQAQARRALRQQLAALEKLERIEAQAAPAGSVPAPAAVRMVQALMLQKRDEDEADGLVAKTDALILEMSRRMASGGV